MSTHPGDPSLQEFLLLHAFDRPVDELDAAEVKDSFRELRQSGPASADLSTTHAALRAEIMRHSDRSMTVVSRGGIETITRCRVCPHESTTPCRALRLLAMPYARHPRFRPEWLIEPPAADVPPARTT
jgi:hypothetical protein